MNPNNQTGMSRIDEIMKDLENPQYWDLFILGKYRRLQTRQEHDRDICLAIRDRIIKALVTERRQSNH